MTWTKNTLLCAMKLHLKYSTWPHLRHQHQPEVRNHAGDRGALVPVRHAARKMAAAPIYVAYTGYKQRDAIVLAPNKARPGVRIAMTAAVRTQLANANWPPCPPSKNSVRRHSVVGFLKRTPTATRV